MCIRDRYGPDKDLPGFDFTAFFARGGYFETLRQRSDVPFNGAPGVGDHNVGMNLVAGILAALYQAKTKGVGEKVETSLFESAVYNMGMMVQASNYEGIAQQYPINIRNGANPVSYTHLDVYKRQTPACFGPFVNRNTL